jgi:hypothetical protein
VLRSKEGPEDSVQSKRVLMLQRGKMKYVVSFECVMYIVLQAESKN